ncbi:MAG: TetR/AcrR family transcriptional regulator [Actinobacteria bacterium]|nr:TetR/AcrR family transcriptional regulator [Actinomycetota bacterium]
MVETRDTDNIIELFEDESRPMTKSERTRLKIMASAAKVFNEKGFDNTSIQDIANDAGIAKGTIYYYVEKKEDLLLSLIRFAKVRLFAKIGKGIEKATTASEKIEIIIRNHLKIVKTVGPVMPFFAQSLVSNDSRVREIMAGFRREYLNRLESIIKEGIQSGEFRQVDPGRAAVAILGLVIGQALQFKLFTGKINTKEIAENTIDIAINGLRQGYEG